jgi:hypothetical protein
MARGSALDTAAVAPGSAKKVAKTPTNSRQIPIKVRAGQAEQNTPSVAQ